VRRFQARRSRWSCNPEDPSHTDNRPGREQNCAILRDREFVGSQVIYFLEAGRQRNPHGRPGAVGSLEAPVGAALDLYWDVADAVVLKRDLTA
jgi:hypothetical protein